MPGGMLPDTSLMLLFAAGAVVMRGAGCTINDLIDRDIDKRVTRTMTRPLAHGDVSVPQAVGFLALQMVVGLGILLCLNNYSIVLGASSLLLVGVYPFMKRVTYWPQLVLGLAFNWGALMGYAAVQGFCSWSVVLPLYAAGICWTLVYDTIYAHQDKADDLLLGVKSTAIRFGDHTKSWLSAFAAASIASLAAAGFSANLSWPFYFSITLGAAHLAWQIFSVNLNDSNDCRAKFVSNKWFGLITFVGILASKCFL